MSAGGVLTRREQETADAVLALLTWLRRFQLGEDVFESRPREPRPLPVCKSKLQQVRSQRRAAGRVT